MGQFGGGPVVEGTSGDNSGLSSSQITPSLIKIAAQACRQRKGILREREHLRQCYQVKKWRLVFSDSNQINFANIHSLCFQGLYLHCRAVLQIHGLIQPDKKALPQQQHHHHQGTGGSGAGLESLGPLLSGMVQTVRPEDQLGLVEGGPSSRKNSFNAGNYFFRNFFPLSTMSALHLN